MRSEKGAESSGNCGKQYLELSSEKLDAISERKSSDKRAVNNEREGMNGELE